jgi:hypothetical protein
LGFTVSSKRLLSLNTCFSLEKERVKMKHAQKEKLENYAEIPIQFTSENSTEQCTSNAAVECDLKASMEKRKEEANKPIYLKRV